jgi:TrmH family RNA methyltransferase
MRSLTTSKGRREHALFLVEGVRAVEDGLRAGFLPRLCLYNADLLARTERGQSLLEVLTRLHRQSAGQMELLEASARALQAAADTLHPQGVVAAFPIIEWPAPGTAAFSATPHEHAAPLALICDELRDPGNMGTILRTAEAAGVHAVWLSPGCVDVYSPKVVRAAMGTHFRLPTYPEKQWADIEREVQAMGVPGRRIFGTHVGASIFYDQIDWRGPSALIISNEAHGISDAARTLAEHSGGLITIPMSGQTESLNAAIAAAIILFEAARQRRRAFHQV